MSPIKVLLLLGIVIFVLGLLWNNTRPIDGIDRDLLEAANGNKELARRLLIQARAKYPDKSERWYVEKVIYDLNRDRGIIKSYRSRVSMNGVSRLDAREKMFFLASIILLVNSLTSFFDRMVK